MSATCRCGKPSDGWPDNGCQLCWEGECARLWHKAMSLPYTVETATVYRVGNRRYFTRRAAIFGYARDRVKAKHRPECGDKGEWNEWLIDHGKDIQYRYGRMLMRALRRRKKA